MLSAFVRTFIALQPCFCGLSITASSSPGQESSPWFVGCFTAGSIQLFVSKGACDLDPVTCSERCLDEGYQFAALSSETCYCSNQLHGLVVSGCVNTSFSQRTIDVRGGSERQRAFYLPLGNVQDGNVALYRTEGPFLYNISVSVSPDRVHAGMSFLVTLYGNLAGRPTQPTGITGLGGKDLSYVTVEFLGNIWKGQSSFHVNVSHDGSFTLSFDWMVKTPGKYNINFCVSNWLSTLSSTLHLSVLQLPLGSLAISLLHGPLGVPSCIPFTHWRTNSVPVEAVYQGKSVTLQAYVREGLATQFYWRFTHKGKEKSLEGVETACLSFSDCQNSTVSWMFDTEGVHTVSVNASSAHGWTQETVHVVVVHPVASDLRLNVSGGQMACGENISVGLELFTTMRHQLVLKVAFEAENNEDKEDLCRTEPLNSGNLSWKQGNICWHGGISDSHHFHLLRVFNPSSCTLHLDLSCHLPAAAGEYRLEASIYSSTDPPSVLLSTVLPQTLKVYEPICILRPSYKWRSVVSTHTEFNLEVSSHTSCMGLSIVWSISFDEAIVINRTTEELKITVSLPREGYYFITVQAFNPVSQVSFQTQILAQEPAGELVLDISHTDITNKYLALFRITAGSNMTVSLLVNSTVLYRNSSYPTGAEATVVLLFNRSGTVAIELQAENKVSRRSKSVRICVEGKRKLSPQAKINPTWQPSISQSSACSMADKAVRIYAEKQAYPTNADIIFLAVADIQENVEFLWDFGDSVSVRTTSRTTTKKYHNPGSYNVVVVASYSQMSITSDVFPLVVQRAVKLNRLVHKASVLFNQMVTVSCRVNVGTDLSFLWKFGDGITRHGESTVQHVFHRIGEFRVEVNVSNVVSWASLSSYIFVVDQPCQPPPVKNMGPLKIQVQRHEVIRLGVTLETEVDCDTPVGLNYTWTLSDSAGQTFPLPFTDTHKQSLILQSHLLQYDTYTAIARVQVINSVVYSNYTVRVQVIPSPPVASIQGGTNTFIDKKTNKLVTLDGQTSFDPDFPLSPLSYSWTCKPVSVIPSSCFNQSISTSSPVLKFPASLLQDNFDQFKFTLTVQNGERSASLETFLTVTSDLIRTVSITCPQCRGDHVNWDQSFSVSAVCDDCNTPEEFIQYTWSLYLVNASSKPFIDVPFCHTVDLLTPSTILENPAASTLTLGISNLLDDAFDYDVADRTSSNKGRGRLNVTGSQPSMSTSVHDSGSGLHLGHTDQSGIISESLVDPDSSADWDFSFPLLDTAGVNSQIVGSVISPDDYEIPLSSLEEGDPGMSAGRLTGAERFSPEDDSVFDPALHKVEGSNLVDPRPLVVLHEPSLLDLHRDAIHRELFESYTYTGISSPLLRLRPFSLRPRSIYMFEVTAKSKDIFLGRNQLFLKTSPVPKGMTCQVQPVKGMELYTHFSIFCTSGREDLLYEYSFSIGGRAPRILYQGRDFQHYFSLPSGDPSDDYKVTIYTEIRSGAYGSATKPCPVTVQVKPSFLRNTSSSSHHDPDLKLSELGLRNLSALVQLGNSVEIRNYISLLSSILNRLSLDAEANTHAQMHMRNVLIYCVCELEINEQVSVVDSIFILNDLLKFTSQVTLMSARKITSYVQAVSKQFSRSNASDSYHGNQKMLNSLVSLLSYDLKVVTSFDYTFKTPKSADDSQAFESGLPTDNNIKDSEENPSRCLLDPSTDPQVNQRGSVLIEEGMQLVDDILQTASDVLLRYVFFYETKELRVSSDYITLNVAFQQKNSTYIHSGSTSFYMPASLIKLLFVRHSGRAQPREHQPCVLRVLTELTHSPYTWAKYPAQTSGPVVDLSLYKCSTRRKIHIHSLSQPISIELQHPQKNMSSLSKYILLRSKVNYHNFSITQEHLQQAIQVTVVLNSPPNKAFPIMLLFRMFERPVPSTHHLHKIHRWENNTTRITLLPSYFNAAGVGHLALLDTDFEKVPRRKNQSEQISYSLTVDSSQCLSWDGQQGAWTHHGCRTQQVDTTSLVNCSCYHLRPLTVFWQQIQSSHDTTDLDPFLSVPSDLTVLGVLILCLCLYMPGLAWCRRADAVSEANQRIHYLSDNSPTDQYLYAVTVYTGLCSAACMSAKVYIMLYGEDGSSQTRELQVQGSSLFRRNSQDTFILSAADSLGPLWGVHIWHDNSGPSPDWYLKLVEVSEVDRGHVKLRSWMFVSQCWLAVNKGDGRVERMLRVGTHGISFSKILFLKLFDYLADLHIWMSVYSCPIPNSFTHTQRLGVCALLLLGYACANAVIVSQTDDQLPFKIGIVDLSAASITSGLISVAAVLPAATLVSYLFRLRGIRLAGSGVRHANGRMTDDCLADTFPMNANKVEPHLSRSDPQQWLQETWRKKFQDIELLSVSTTTLENKDSDEEFIIQPDVVMRKEDDLALRSSVGPVLQTFLQIPEWSNCDYTPQSNESELLTEGWKFNGNQRAARDEGQTFLQERGFGITSLWCHHVAWVLCVLLSLCCLLFSAVLGLRFSSSKILLWIHALFVSLMSCIFFIQPAVILAVAVTVSCWYKNKTDIQIFSSKLWSQDSADQPKEHVEPTAIPQKTSSYTEELLRARQRSRYLRFVRPPTPARLRKSREKKRRESLICKTLRDLGLFGSMLLLMMCISYDSSFKEHYHLNRAVTRHFIRNHNNVFMSIKNHEDWWNWAQTSLLHLLYQNTSAKTTQLHIVIGDPIVQKTETPKPFQSQVPMVTPPRTYDHGGFYSEAVTSVGLGSTKSDAASQLKHLHSSGWLGRQTVALRVQFTLYSPAPNLFTSVTLLTEQSSSGVLLPSAEVQSVRVYHSPAGWDYVAMLCQLLFFLVSLLLLCNQISTIAQQGLMRSWKTPCTWVEVCLLITTLVYYVCSINHSNLIVEVVELLQRHNRRHVDVSFLATSEQLIRTLRGVILFLLTMRSMAVLRVNRTVATSAAAFAHSLTSILWPMIAGLILLVLLFCLLYGQSSWTFSSIPRSLQMLLCRHMGLQSARGLLRSGPDFSYWAVLYLSSVVLWTATVIGVMSSLVKMTKRSQSRRNVLTIADLLCYIRQRIFEFTGQQRQTGTDNHDEGRTYFLEEFESLVDELLFRLNALSNSLHHTLPPKAHHYREEDSPAIPSTPESTNMDTQDFMRSQTVNKPTCVSDKGQTSAGSCLFGFQFEHDNQKALHQRGQMVHNWQSICEAADDILKIKDCLTRPKSRSIKRLWTEDVRGKNAELCTKANGTCKLSKAHGEMVVEVLVHKEPGRGESDMF